MVFKLHVPEGRIGQYVQSIVYHEGYTDKPMIERLLPDGTVNLILELSNTSQYTYNNGDLSVKQEFKSAWISGMHSEFISISALPKSAMLVIQFRAGGSYPILHTPLSELNNSVFDADTVLGVDIALLQEQLATCKEVSKKLQLAEQWCLSRLSRGGSIPYQVVAHMVSSMQNDAANYQIKDAVQASGYSHQHLIGLFKKYVGLTPEKFQQVMRFNQLLCNIDQQGAIEWTGLGLDYGYYDQPHFIHDFQRFAGFSPSAYLKMRGEFMHYITVGQP